MRRQKFAVAAIYDTETCNVGNDAKTARAFPVLFIDNDVRDIDFRNYTPEKDDKVNFYRHENEMQERIDKYILWGTICDVVPIICAYNLMFDLKPLMYNLAERYNIQANAQSSTNVYTLDLYDKESGKMLLRFWDTFHLEMRGLSAMGETAGLGKAIGSWDYSLIRTPETPLTEEELFYAKRDVQVIPAYFKYLLNANEWMQQSDLGVKVLTKTSIVRQMARKKIAQIKIPKQNGKVITIDKMFMELCKQEMPQTYTQYALRKACFRGGYTFTSARYAMEIQRNVVSVDVTSMHHTFINGRMVPDKFTVKYPWTMNEAIEEILNTDRDYIMEHYEKPFNVAIHARVRIKNIRLRKNSCFAEWGIGLAPMSKFKKSVDAGTEYGMNIPAVMQEEYIRENGWVDRFKTAEFAFGKLYSASEIDIHLNEIELWSMSRVYEWDSIECIFGELTHSFIKPPDYVTLQSNLLFEAKSAAKHIASKYVTGVPYDEDISSVIPEGIAETLKNGTCNSEFFNQYYTSTVKGMFNGIYGTQAQDVFKPSYICVNGELVVDKDTIANEENFESKKPKTTRVFYNYGMRIVGGSRMHMIIAMELIYERFGNKARVLGGDTDSMKISCDYDVTDDMISDALEIMGTISKNAIDRCMVRIREKHKEFASTLKGIGSFEIENYGKHYDYHFEAWNKARISFTNGKSHITCAGLSRPVDKFHIEKFIDNLVASGFPIEDVMKNCLCYNAFISADISHALEGHIPKASDVYNKEVTDYLGNTVIVNSHESNALFPAGRWLGDLNKTTNALSVKYLINEYKRNIDTRNRYILLTNNRPEICVDGVFGLETIMIGERVNV